MTRTRIQVWDPVREAVTLRDAMDRLFQESYVRPANGDGSKTSGFVPRADAWEDEDTVTIEMPLPGVNPQDVDVTFEQDNIEITGEIPQREDERNWVMSERARGPFQRRFSLNVPVDADRAEAQFAHGVLTLSLPKREEIKPRKIAVNVTE